jgi:hypothetical protein
MSIKGPLVLHLTLGASKNRFILHGVDYPHDFFDTNFSKGVLYITAKKAGLVLDASLDQLTLLKLKDVMSATINSRFEGSRLKIISDGVPHCHFFGHFHRLDLTGRHETSVRLSGYADRLVAHLYEMTQLNAGHLEAREVMIKTWNNACAVVYPKNRLFMMAMGQSQIMYIHRPPYVFDFPLSTGLTLYVP